MELNLLGFPYFQQGIAALGVSIPAGGDLNEFGPQCANCPHPGFRFMLFGAKEIWILHEVPKRGTPQL